MVNDGEVSRDDNIFVSGNLTKRLLRECTQVKVRVADALPWVSYCADGGWVDWLSIAVVVIDRVMLGPRKVAQQSDIRNGAK